MINGINLEPFGKKVMGNIKGHFETNALFRDLFPKFCPPKNKKWDTQSEFTVPNCNTDVGTPTCMMGSFGSPRTGFHYDYIINDDPHNEENTNNMDQMEKTIHCWEAQEALGKGYQTVRFQVATFWHHGDLNNHMINLLAPQFRDDCESGKRVHNVNYLKRKGTDTDFLKVYLLSIYDTKGQSIWPDRLPNAELERKKLKMGLRFFKMQYENNVVPEEEQTFKPHYFRYYKRISRITDRGVTRQFYVCGQKKVPQNGELVFVPRLIPFDEVVNRITVDPAFGVKDYNDEVAIVVVGHWTDPEMRLPWYLLLDYVARKMEISESQALIEQKVEEWNAKDVGIESHAQVLYLNQILRESRWAGPGKVNFIPISRMSEKIVGKARVRRLEPVYESGRMWHAESMRGGKVEKVLKAFVGGSFVGARPDLADALGDHVDFAAAVPVRDYDPLNAVTRSYGTWDDDPEYAYAADDNAPDWETM